MKALCGVEIFLLVAATLAAQDVVRVDPQHYKVLFENSHIRVIEGRDRPGDITPMHHHPAYLSYLDGPVKAKIVSLDGSVMIYGPGDDSWCSPPTTHSTENIGTTNTHEVVVEFKDFDPCGDSSLLPATFAQDKPKPHVQIPVIAARPEDVSSPEAIVTADYESISGGVGLPRQWARDLSLYDPNARSFSVDKDSKTGALMIWSPTLQEYADDADAHFVREGFTEHEVAHKVHRFGNVATVFSSYEGKFTSTGKLYTRGVNTYQLYYDGKRWWISSVTWDAENYISPIPAELLPQK